MNKIVQNKNGVKRNHMLNMVSFFMKIKILQKCYKNKKKLFTNSFSYVTIRTVQRAKNKKQ